MELVVLIDPERLKCLRDTYMDNACTSTALPTLQQGTYFVPTRMYIPFHTKLLRTMIHSGVAECTVLSPPCMYSTVTYIEQANPLAHIKLVQLSGQVKKHSCVLWFISPYYGEYIPR